MVMLKMGVEDGTTPSIRGIVKCLKCKNHQSFISYNKKTKEAIGPRRESTCMKCGHRHRFRIQAPGRIHGNYFKKRKCIFMKRDSSTPRSKLVQEAQMRNAKTNGFR